MPSLYIEPEDIAYIRAAVAKADWREIGGLGIIDLLEDGTPVVRHMRLLEQTISSSEVDWADNAQADYLTWLYTPVDQGGAGFTGSNYGLYSWHSHGSMSTFYSNTDEDFITKMGLTVPWIFSSIYNKKGESRHRCDVFQGVSDLCPAVTDGHIYWEDKGVNLYILEHPDAAPWVAQIEKAESEYEAMIKVLEKEHNTLLKSLEDSLKEATKSAGVEAVARMEADYKEFVTLPPTKTWTKSSGPGSTATGSKSADSMASTNGGVKNVGNGDDKGKNDDADTGSGSDLGQPGDGVDEGDIRVMKWYRVWDASIETVYYLQLSKIIPDMDLILLEDIEDDVLALLREDEVHMLACRDNLHDLANQLDPDLNSYGTSRYS